MQHEFGGTSRFRVLARLGTGGMGVVYRAHDCEQDCDVALKTLQRFQATDLYRLKREFRALAGVSHPNLVSLYELVSDGGQWFFTMELVDGVDFRSWVSPGATAASPCSELRDTTVSISTPTPPTESVRKRAGPIACDLVRLRSALRQLVAGVQALHESGRLHRDIKPSNVLVTREGRVVLLDFGLVLERPAAFTDESFGDRLVGTPAYMSPEQAAGQPLTSAADWYSVGVMLYEALTARLPFEGTLAEVLDAKKRRDPPAPAELADVPADLNDLCISLLRRCPEDRPSGSDILALPGAPASTRAAALTPPFVGRTGELARLSAAYSATRNGTAVVVHVSGGSGIGKTALVQRFLSDLHGATILTSRCYERESVPYKALDSAIDSLSRHLQHLGTDAAALLPRDVRPLARLFPVLAQAPAVAAAPVAGTEIVDPQRMRRRAFASLKELLARIADRGPLVVWIDDLQWGDEDSAALLLELLRPPDAPAALFVLGYRADAVSNECVRSLREQVAGQALEVGPLSVDDARELAAGLLPATDAARAHAVAREAEGNPLFVAELARQTTARGTMTFAQMLVERIGQLDQQRQRLLEVVAVAGAPIELACAVRAAGIGERPMTAVASLRAHRLLRPAADGKRVEVYHDRIREVVVAQLDSSALKACHLSLAEALESVGAADPETLSTHLHAAGELERAGRHAMEAARAAANALAFDRAARLYRMALDTAAIDRDTRRQLQIELATCLANGGRGGEAGATFLFAATDAPPDTAFELRRRAADQYLRSGQAHQGIAVLGGLLETLGIRMSATPRAALLRLMCLRALIGLRGLSYRERTAAEVDPAELVRVDVCRTASFGLSMIDNIRGADFQARCTLRALRAGEPRRIAVALAVEAAQTGVAGNARAYRRAEQILAVAEPLARRLEYDYALGLIGVARGAIECCYGNWSRAREYADRGVEILRERCVGASREMDTGGIAAAQATFYLGDLRNHARRVESILDGANARGDLYGSTAMRSLGATVWLAADDLSRARSEIERARADWRYPGFSTQHRWLLLGETLIDLYAGEPRRAYARIEERWPAFRRSMLGRVRMYRLLLMQLRGVAALALAGSIDSGRERLLDDAADVAAELGRAPFPSVSPLGLLIAAGVACAEGQKEGAVSCLEQAASAFDAADMKLHATLARYRLGGLIEGSKGRELVSVAREWLAANGVRRPELFVSMLAPMPA
jgi:eukaryotic-like serine/threonine-protein kinase